MKKLAFLLILGLIALISTGATRDTYSGSNALATKVSLADSVDTNGTGIDLFGYEGALIIANVGAGAVFSDTTVSLELEVEESADNSSFTDVADAHLIGYVAGTNDGCFGVIDYGDEDQLVYYASYIGSKRYIRVVCNYVSTGTAPADITPVSATVVRMYPKYGPAH
jgi:hypothetical protein